MKVSIIIPVYNVANYIEQCLNSVFSQTYKDIQIIIVDDCSLDNSMEIVEKTIKSYRNILDILVIHQPFNKGLSAARNIGIEKSIGDYVYFLDSDDEITQDCIQLLVDLAIKYPDADFVVGKIKTIGHVHEIELTSSEYVKGALNVFSDFIQYKWNLAGCNKLIKKSFLLDNNIFFINRLHEDNDSSFLMALCANAIACCYIPTYLYYYRPGSICSYKRLKNYQDLCFIICQNLQRIKAKDLSLLKGVYISNYVVHEIFNFMLELIKERNPEITYLQRKELIYSLIEQKKSLPFYGFCSGGHLIKNIVLKLPFFLLVPMIRIYAKLRHL